MRLDKFLKVSRIIRQRARAKELCDQGAVQMNGRPAKAGHEVVEGDVLSITIGDRLMTIRVVRVPAGHVPKSGASDLFISEGVIDLDESFR